MSDRSQRRMRGGSTGSETASGEGKIEFVRERPPSEKERGRGITRRDVLKLGAASGAAAAVAAVATAPAARADGGSGGTVTSGTCTGLSAIEAFPTSPLILQPFIDPLPIPKAAAPCTDSDVATWANQPGAGVGQQDCDGGTHQLWPGKPGSVVANYPSKPIVYHNSLQVRPHSFTSSPVRTLIGYRDAKGKLIPAGTVVSKLPDSTIYGFNGTFPGPMINAEYGKPVLVRFDNQLDQNPYNLDRQDFGAPDWAFLTHLHNAHTAPECDGNPHHKPGAYQPGGWVDNVYLNYPAGGDEAEKQSFFWYHDHRMDHTGANVYKGMVGIYPIYDPVLDPGDETKGLRLPGVRTNNPDGSFDVAYDVPLVFYDCALDDGATPHQDFHNGCGETHPEWWGKTFFRHFPNHGFVGDVFTVNGKAYPVMEVKRRKYRFRFLTAAVSRQFELQFMTSRGGPKSAASLGYSGTELQGQYRIEDGQQCLRMTQIASGGGLLPSPIIRNSIENWPAMRHEVVVDFTRYLDGTPTKKGDVIYLANICKMPDGRMATNNSRVGLDPRYKIPLLKIIIGDDAPDNSVMPSLTTVLRRQPAIPSNWSSLPQRTFELQRGGFGGEIQWLINGHPFDPTVPLATVKQGNPEVWTIKNGGGGWTHPMHLHMEEHHVMSRNGKTFDAGHPDDTGKDDVLALDPSEQIVVYRNFRTFLGNYVAHCHNLAHEDHAMMFGWKIAS